jgi:hypothetical protein
MSTSSGAYFKRSAFRKLPQIGVSIREQIGSHGDVHPAETDLVPPEQHPLLGALPNPAPMQGLDSPLEVCEALTRELESMLADFSSYTGTLESRIFSFRPILPQTNIGALGC